MIKTEKRYEDGSLRERIRMIKVMTSIYIKHTGSEMTHKCGEKSIKARKSTKESSYNRGTWEGVIWCDARKEGETVYVNKTYTLGGRRQETGNKEYLWSK